MLIADAASTESFYPRPRAGGDRPKGSAACGWSTGDVSIRAPVRGATRGDIMPIDASPDREGFYPRPRAGGDADASSTMSHTNVAGVSIRAPVRGATVPVSEDCR